MDLVRRSGWGAAEPKGKPVQIATPVKHLFLHHSVTPDHGPDTVRSIQKFHIESRGWNDIAYTWLYSPSQRTFFEGRGPGVAGAHTRGHNKTSHGLCVLGNFQVTKPPRHVIEDLAAWARWHGGTYGPDRYMPHLDVTSTLCPGQHLVAMVRDINNAARQDIPSLTTPPDVELPPTVRLGDTGDDVKFLQTFLMPHDGTFGPQTHDQVRMYQQANGLTVDGICGPQTWRSILGL
jgi:peptidoglycan hydrolase-like protein with peptidoglycan-binding domain